MCDTLGGYGYTISLLYGFLTEHDHKALLLQNRALKTIQSISGHPRGCDGSPYYTPSSAGGWGEGGATPTRAETERLYSPCFPGLVAVRTSDRQAYATRALAASSVHSRSLPSSPFLVQLRKNKKNKSNAAKQQTKKASKSQAVPNNAERLAINNQSLLCVGTMLRPPPSPPQGTRGQRSNWVRYESRPPPYYALSERCKTKKS